MTLKTFVPRPNFRRDEPRRANQKTPSSLGGLLGGMLQRHGIGAQVLAARVVSKGNEILQSMLTPEQQQDMRVQSFASGQLTIACRNASAKFFLGQQIEVLGRKLEEEVPEISVREIRIELRPDVWSKSEAWEG